MRDGTTDDEEWLVFDSAGEFSHYGTITGIPEEGRLDYDINQYGAVAWAPFTEEFPRIFLLSSD